MGSYLFSALKQHEKLSLDPDSPWCIAICPHCAAIGPDKDMDEHIEKWCSKEKEGSENT